MEGQTIEQNNQDIVNVEKPKLKRGRKPGIKFPNGYKKKSELNQPVAPVQENKI